MDKNEFRTRLEQVAIIKDRKPAKTAQHNRRATEIVVEYDEDGNEIEIEREITENPTLGFELVKVKEKNAICELGCGDIVTNQVVEKRYCETPKPHWRTKCNNCGCFVSPDGIGFIEGGHAVQAAYMKFFRGEKIRPELKPNQTVKYESGREYIEEVTNNSIIKKYK